MCFWWNVRVTVIVMGNLVLRMSAELKDVVAKLLLAWWCLPKSAQTHHISESELSDHGWYVRINRKQANAILKRAETNGAFLIRPSSKPDNVCTLSVWHDNQPFHINVRLRPDGWLALGTTKPNEQCFAKLQDIVELYTRDTLVIHSNGQQFATVLVQSDFKKNH